MSAQPQLRAPYVLEYAYRRSLGPALREFFTALRDGRLVAIKGNNGDVIIPPQPYDPQTGEALDLDFVDVGPGGTVRTWTWIAEPRDKHPLDRPFAFALIVPDGATTALLHAVDAGDENAMKTGMRVEAVFADERTGCIQDLRYFKPTDDDV